MTRQYKIFADFYKLKINKDDIIHCRSYLEILEDNLNQEFERIVANAIFVLKNPGRCSPIIEEFDEDIVELNNFKRINKKLVEADSDNTLRQLINVMKNKKWAKIIVINLSDIKSTSQFEQLHNKIKQFNNPFTHSIFSYERRNELNNRIQLNKNVPLICAWTYNPPRDLVNLFFKSDVGKIKRFGISDGEFGYKHPYQWSTFRNEIWVNDLLKIIE